MKKGKKKWIVIGVALLLSVMASLAVFGACSTNVDNWGGDGNGGRDNAAPDMAGPPSSEGGTGVGEGAELSQNNPTERRIIYTYTGTIYTDDMDETLRLINAAWNNIVDARVQSMDRRTQGGIAIANITLRIPTPYFHVFINQLPQTGTVAQEHITSRDVTLAFFDLQARLGSARSQRERLLELRDTATNLHTILDLDARIRILDTEIDNIVRAMNNYDSLVQHSTVILTIRQDVPPPPPVEPSLGERIGNVFAMSGRAIGTFFEYLFYGIILVGPFLLFFGAIAFGGIMLHFKVIKKRRLAKKVATPTDSVLDSPVVVETPIQVGDDELQTTNDN